MKKIFTLFSIFFLTITFFNNTFAISDPKIEIVDGTITTSSVKINATHSSSYTGDILGWSIDYKVKTDTQWVAANPEPSAKRVNVPQDPATRNCPVSNEQTCGLQIRDYELKGLQCGTQYSVRFRVAQTQAIQTISRTVANFRTRDCDAHGTVLFKKNTVVRGSTDTSGKLVLGLDISELELTGEQTAEISVAVEPKANFTGTTFTNMGAARGIKTISFEKEIPGINITCGVNDLLYLIKVKINNQDYFWPQNKQGAILLTECGSAIENSGGGNETTGDNTYTFLTPLPFNEGLKSQKSVVIGATEGGGIFGILQRIFTLMLVAAVVLAVVFMIIGGARYATGDTLGGKMSGRQIITNAITGLLFALLSWLLLNIINPDLLRLSLVIPNVGKLNTGSSTGIVNGGSDDVGNNDTITGNGCGVNVSDEECFDMIAENEDEIRNILKQENISIERGDVPCEQLGQKGCTMVGLLNETTLNRLIEVKNDCVAINSGCRLIITGATEFWLHAKNGNHRRFTAVDLKINREPFDGFVKGKTKVANPFNLCVETYSYKGLRFCNESRNHWHVDTTTSTGGGNEGSGAGQIFTFPHIDIQGYVAPNTGRVYTATEISTKIDAPAMKALEQKIRTVATRESIDFKLFYSLIAQESGGNPQAGSSTGACGVTQLLPSSASTIDSTLTGDICTKLKNDVDLSISLGAKYFKKYGTTPKDKLAHYNGGNQALESSVHCQGRKKYECPWDVAGYYDRSNPSGAPLKALENQSDINTGFSETRFYVINILNMAAAMR